MGLRLSTLSFLPKMTVLISKNDAAIPSLPTAERERLSKILSQVDADLTKNVLPFWTKHTLDAEHGGFHTAVDYDGKPISPPGEKLVIMQARMVWTLAAAHEHGIRDQGYLEQAKNGAEFLINKMWDDEQGGFHMTVHPDGTPSHTEKFVYAQEYVIYALSEYARVAGDQKVLNAAIRTWDVVQQRAADPERGGFQEDFDGEWNPFPFSMGCPNTASGKTLNMHMHLMEALTALVKADPKQEYKDALAEVTDLIRTKAITPQGYALEPFDIDWNPKPDAKGRMSTFYGHNIELGWLIVDAYNAMGRPLEEIKPQALALIDHALEYGFDWERGGLAEVGPYEGAVTEDPAYTEDNARKQWWEQAEAMVAVIMAYQWTGTPKYLEAFEKLWSWIYKYHIDHVGGDWFASVDWTTGEPIDKDKACSGWKVCWHNGRALMVTSTILTTLLEQP